MPAPHAFIQAGVVHRRPGLLPSMEVIGWELPLGFLGVRFPTLPLVYLCFVKDTFRRLGFFVDCSFRWTLALH